MKKVCYWSIADGEYAFMLKSLIYSFRKAGMIDDFIAISDRNIDNATNTIITDIPKDLKWGCWFKLWAVKNFMKHLDYDYFVFLDSDNWFVRKPGNILEFMKDTPMHTFLECDCTNPKNLRKEWWDCPLEVYIKLMRDMGVILKKVYNINGGFFIVNKNAIDTLCELCNEFYLYSKSKGYRFVDEPPLAYSTHMLCGDIENHTMIKRLNIWSCDWTGNFLNKIPNDKNWIFEQYFTGEKKRVNPSIVHSMRSKTAMIEFGKTI